jgi:hypothetical protein
MSLDAVAGVRRWLCLCTLALAGVSPGFAQEPPSPSDVTRFLRQSTFGPTPDLIAHVQQVGFDAFLGEQFAAPITSYPDLPDWPAMRPTMGARGARRLDR